MILENFWSKKKIAVFVSSTFILFSLSFDAVMAVSAIINSSFPFHNPLTNSLISASYAGGIGLGHFVLGPVFDLKGPVKVFIMGMFVLSISSLFAYFTDSIIYLLIARFIQGFGISTQFLGARYLINDYFPEEIEAARVYSITYIVSFLGSLIMPISAVYLLQVTSWNVIFLISAILSLVVLVILCYFPSYSSQYHVSSISYWEVYKSYLKVFYNYNYLFYTLLSSLFASWLYLYFVSISFIMQDLLKVDAFVYAYLLSINMGFAALGSLINIQILKYFSINSVINCCYYIFCLATLALFFITISYDFTDVIVPNEYHEKIYLINCTFIVMIMVYAIVSPNLLTKAISNITPDSKGNALSVLGIMQFLFGVVICNAIGLVAIIFNSVLIISLGMNMLAFTCIGLDLLFKKYVN